VVDGVFRVDKIGLPIDESRAESMTAIGLQNCDFFGAFPSLSEYLKVQEQETVHGEEGSFAILSDVHLDRPDVLTKLEKLFDGLQQVSPLPVFVLMGNFTSKPMSSSINNSKAIIGYFEELGNIISQYPRIAKNGRFVIIPGPNDPGIGSILPHQPIPEYFVTGLRSKVQRLVLTSNPCRFRYFTKELLFFRQDATAKFLENSLTFRNQDTEDTDNVTHHRNMGNKRLFSHLVQTVIHQGHLCPLPEIASPIFWQYDHVLRLNPIPDALILGDRMEQMYENYLGCDVINCGPFIRDFSFVMYRPIGEGSTSSSMKSDVEFSQID
jgi:DNA polymerase epsilon subunit 2